MAHYYVVDIRRTDHEQIQDALAKVYAVDQLPRHTLKGTKKVARMYCCEIIVLILIVCELK